jgi:flagellar biosynthesis component FlhA
MRKLILATLFSILLFSIQCKDVSKNELEISKIQKNLTDSVMIKNAERDFETLNNLIYKEADIKQIKKYVDNSLEKSLSEQYGDEFSNNVDQYYKEAFLLVKKVSDSLNAMPKNEIETAKVQLKSENKAIISLVGFTNMINNKNNEVAKNKFVILGISEDYGNNFKFLNVYDVEQTRNILKYKFTKEEINSMKPFKKK